MTLSFVDVRSARGPTRRGETVAHLPAARRPDDLGGLGLTRPVCFLHIAKTGGTSLTDAIARLYPPDLVFTGSGGNITAEDLAALGPRLERRVFLAGHAGPGVAAVLEGRADMITLLRRPADQAVSNYLHILSDPENALHGEALRGSFSDYLRRNDHQIDYQATSLSVAMTADPDRRAALRYDQDPVVGFLDALAFVGVVERAEACGEVLSRLFPHGESIVPACLNAAVNRGVSRRTLDRLRREYEGLRADPCLAPIFAREARIYAAAEAALQRLEDRLLGGSRRGRKVPPPAFLSAARFRSVGGAPVGSAIVAALPNAAHLIHGPYDLLPRGRYEARFDFTLRDTGPRTRGRIQLEAFEAGLISLRRRWLARGAWNLATARSLVFVAPEAANVMEFRMRAEGFDAGRLIFEGVTLRPCSPWRAWPSVITRFVSRLRHVATTRWRDGGGLETGRGRSDISS